MADDQATPAPQPVIAYYKPLPPARFDIPDATGICIPSTAFADKLELFQDGIASLIAKLRNKQPTDKFALEFDISFHHNGIASLQLVTDNATNTTKFTLKCYCNGGN